MKNSLDKNCPYNGTKHDIYSLRNEGNIFFVGHFNPRTTTSQAIILRNDSKPDHLWLDEDLLLSRK